MVLSIVLASGLDSRYSFFIPFQVFFSVGLSSSALVGMTPLHLDTSKAKEARPAEKNTWKGMKKDYLKDNPDAKTMDNTTLKMPPKDYILPLPKPKVDND